MLAAGLFWRCHQISDHFWVWSMLVRNLCCNDFLWFPPWYASFRLQCRFVLVLNDLWKSLRKLIAVIASILVYDFLISSKWFKRQKFIIGITGSAITSASVPYSIKKPVKLGVTALHDEVKPAQGFGLEFLFTFSLVFFVFSITDPKKKIDPFGVALGIGINIWVAHVCLVGSIYLSFTFHTYVILVLNVPV